MYVTGLQGADLMLTDVNFTSNAAFTGAGLEVGCPEKGGGGVGAHGGVGGGFLNCASPTCCTAPWSCTAQRYCPPLPADF